ncbi:MAG: hypothetical protein Q9216_005025 [Gyalolechia sp. 2 TL-2023]
MMGMLFRVLPVPVFRFLKKTINPPKAPEDKYQNYTDLLVILEISRDVMDSSLQLLRSLVRSFNESLPGMIRCDMHAHLMEGQDCTVHLLLRFTNEDSARNFVVEEVDFQVWLTLGEENGYWTCCTYQMGFTLVAGFDRGRSGRTTLSSHRRTEARETTLPPRPTPTRKTTPISTSKATSKQKGERKGMAKKSERPLNASEAGCKDIDLQGIMAAEKEVNHEEMPEEGRVSRESVRNSSSPAHGNPYNQQYQSPHGPAFNQINERQRMVYELTHQNRQNVAARPPMNGGGGPRPFSGHPAPHSFQHPYHSIPQLPPPDNLSEQQRYVRDLIIKLDGDKKLLLESRKATSAELKRLQKEIDGFEEKQRGQEYLRWIYPLQAEVGRIEGIHDGYGPRMMNPRSSKRQRLSQTNTNNDVDGDSDLEEISATVWNSTVPSGGPREHISKTSRSSISPPPKRLPPRDAFAPRTDGSKNVTQIQSSGGIGSWSTTNGKGKTIARRVVPSPVQLSTVNGLPTSSNIDTVSLGDILSDPLIKECWLFNYLFDVDFVMSQLDEDTRDMVRVKIVHGSWKKEDSNRVHIEEAAQKHENVQVITAYMAEMHDEQAQVIIVTGNFIVRDWSMCQAVWRSPRLPRLDPSHPSSPNETETPRIGSGAKFKKDLLAYLRAYGPRKTGSLTTELDRYDFSGIRAALVASVPGKQILHSMDPDSETLWGWPALKHVLSCIEPTSAEARAHVVMQCSSVASVGEKWMEDTFLRALSSTRPINSPQPQKKPRFSLVFPTADEIRRSVDGYASGGSIHMKTQNAAQLKQLTYLRPMLCHWAGDQSPATVPKAPLVRQALRRRAAPHIKTYIRFSDEGMTKIDWAVMTSANLSKQAWGEAAASGGGVRICSYEIGVVVWPGLWDEGGGVEMVPVLGKDMPDDEDDEEVEGGIEKGEIEQQGDDEETTDEEGGKELRQPKVEQQKNDKTRVGLRMPYDLPLVPYGNHESPWCASMPCAEPDWMGRSWHGFGSS